MRNPVFDIDNWMEIFETLSRNKTRTFLTAFGIFWGVAILAILHGGATGVTGMVMRQFKDFATNMGGVAAGQTSMPYKGYNKGMSWQLTISDIDRFRTISNACDLCSPILVRMGNVSYKAKSMSVTSLGVGSDFFRIQVPIVLAGRTLNEADNFSRSKNIVIGRRVASELFGANPEDAIGKFVGVNGIYYRVVGVVAQRSDASLFGRLDDSVVQPVSVMSLALHTGNAVDFVVFTAKNGHKPKEVIADVHRAARVAHPIHPDDEKAFDDFDLADMFEKAGNIFTGIDILALFVGFGTLLGGVIGVGNIMWIIVRERTSEIGIRRAIGAKPRQIIAQVLSESIVLTTVAGLAGIVFAVIVLSVIDNISYDEVLGSAGYQLTFSSAVGILLTFLVLGTLAGLIPALKAMHIKPVEAMHTK